jgi:hypothetical protein
MERMELSKRLQELDLQLWDITRLETLLIVYLQESEKLQAEVAKLDWSSQGLPPSDR